VSHRPLSCRRRAPGTGAVRVRISAIPAAISPRAHGGERHVGHAVARRSVLFFLVRLFAGPRSRDQRGSYHTRASCRTTTRPVNQPRVVHGAPPSPTLSARSSGIAARGLIGELLGGGGPTSCWPSPRSCLHLEHSRSCGSRSEARALTDTRLRPPTIPLGWRLRGARRRVRGHAVLDKRGAKLFAIAHPPSMWARWGVFLGVGSLSINPVSCRCFFEKE
jgi:hypothetical protein